MNHNSNNMEDQLCRMIEQDIESLLDDRDEKIDGTLVPETDILKESSNSDYLSSYGSENNTTFGYQAYTSAESAANEGLIFGQYVKWSTVESDELTVLNQLVEQQANHTILSLIPYVTVEMMKKILMTGYWYSPMTKMNCSFCKKNGMHPKIYSSHWLRVNGVHTCPFLLTFRCSNCNENGHTNSYCPQKKCMTPNIRLTPNLATKFFRNSSLFKRY